MEPVKFIIGVNEDVDLQTVKSDLEKLAGDFKIVDDLESLGILYGKTSQATYEKVFQAKLEYQTQTRKNINHGKFQSSEWVELQKAQIPQNFKDRINYVELERKIHLTD